MEVGPDPSEAEMRSGDLTQVHLQRQVGSVTREWEKVDWGVAPSFRGTLKFNFHNKCHGFYSSRLITTINPVSSWTVSHVKSSGLTQEHPPLLVSSNCTNCLNVTFVFGFNLQQCQGAVNKTGDEGTLVFLPLTETLLSLWSTARGRRLMSICHENSDAWHVAAHSSHSVVSPAPCMSPPAAEGRS